MFTTDPTIIDLKIKERNLYKAIFSMNFHQVATPELGVDDARCYIFFFREGDKLSAYIVLYMPSTGRHVHYTYSANPFPEADLPMVEDIARAFGEEMGFFLDDKSFASSSDAEKNLWIDEQPLFARKAPADPADAVRTTETTASVPAEQSPPPTAAVDAVRTTETTASVPAEQSTPPTAAADTGASSLFVVQPALSAQEHQPATAAPVYQQAPGQPVSPSSPAAPRYDQPASGQPFPQAPSAAPVDYRPAASEQPVPQMPMPPASPMNSQPASVAPVAAQTRPQPMYHQEVEVEPQVEVEVECDVDSPPPRQKSSAAPRSSTEKVKAAGATPRAARSVRPNPLEEEYRAAQKPSPPAPKKQVKKDTRISIGIVGREMEALARLVASF